ncbi:pyridoxamine 5'-phosphate oxidase family protein [Nitratireductor sp. GCM10026969]|uniref:pyridoxamine 5'-phosphate oxidase family protein n=1 Tax=Nitratireductor sp. GCM10026969 TaxID=3252645 RepID=UPI003622FC2A
MSSPQTYQPLPGWDRDSSPYHAGEQAAQARAGAREMAERIGRKVIRSFMPDQHREFFAELPFVILGSLDAARQPWASILVSPPGFVQSPDPRRLTIAGRPLSGDPLRANLRKDAAVGMLGIQPETRRRNRVNGRVIEAGKDSFTIAVDQSFGNCPQYIQARAPHLVSPASTGKASRPIRREGAALSAEAAELVRMADTFFIATASPGAGGENPVEGADVNHRGGKPGFVDVRQEDGRSVLVAPDFAGNSAFSTFGNLLLNPKAGLLFVDFAAGHVLMVTGEAEVIWDAPEVRAFPGAERLLSFRLSEGLFMANALPMRWSNPEPAPQIAATGTWADVARAADDAAQANTWRRFVVTRVEEENGTVSSFRLSPQDGNAITPHLPGQFLPIAVEVPGEAQPLRRTYTICSDANGREYRLTVKRRTHAGARPSVSNWLHVHARAGTVIHALAPRGDFILDTSSRRPIVLLSAGIGVTPMFAMLDHLTGGMAGRPRQPDRPIFFIHAARNGAEHVFSRDVRLLAERNANLTVHVRYSRPRPQDVPGRDHDSTGRIDRALLQSLLPLDDYEVYLCGPAGFMQTAYDLLTGLGIADEHIHAEAFGPARLQRRAAAMQEERRELSPAAEADVTFRRAGIRVSWKPAEGSLLDLAEAAGVDAPWNCRAGVCGTCTARLVEGSVAYPEEPTASGGPDEVLICSAVPASRELVLDL